MNTFLYDMVNDTDKIVETFIVSHTFQQNDPRKIIDIKQFY